MNAALPSWSHDEFVHISREQQFRENAAARIANRVLICDTNAFTTGTWHERYCGCRNDRVDAIGATDKVALYLLNAPDVPFVQDGFRDGEHIRSWMHGRLVEQLRCGSIPVVDIRGSYPERFKLAVEAIEELINKFQV